MSCSCTVDCKEAELKLCRLAVLTKKPDDTGDPSVGLSAEHEQAVNNNKHDQSVCYAADLCGDQTYPGD